MQSRKQFYSSSRPYAHTTAFSKKVTSIDFSKMRWQLWILLQCSALLQHLLTVLASHEGSLTGPVPWNSDSVIEISAPLGLESLLMSNPRTTWIVLHYVGFCVLPYFRNVAETFIRGNRIGSVSIAFAAVNCNNDWSYCETVQGSTVGKHSTSTFDARVYMPGMKVRELVAQGGSARLNVHSESDLKFWLQEYIRSTLVNNSKWSSDGQLSIVVPTPSQSINVRTFPSYMGIRRSRSDVLTSPSSRLEDASVGLLMALGHVSWHAITPESDYANGRDAIIPSHVVKALHDFLELVATFFPDRQARAMATTLLQTLRSSYYDVTLSQWKTLGASAWTRELFKWNIDSVIDKYSFQHCKSGTCCAFHQIFHILMLAVVEFQMKSGKFPLGPAANKTVMRWTPKEVLCRIVEAFIAELFYCKCCAKPYLELWDANAFNHNQIGDEDGVLMNVWLWQMHNNVTARAWGQGKKASTANKLWPTPLECPTCYSNEQSGHNKSLLLTTADGMKINPEAVYQYLRGVYWKPEWIEEQRSSDSGVSDFPTFRMLLVIPVLVIICVYLCYQCMKKKMSSPQILPVSDEDGMANA